MSFRDLYKKEKNQIYLPMEFITLSMLLIPLYIYIYIDISIGYYFLSA